jgi:mono/diheme cytochrome c family protein
MRVTIFGLLLGALALGLSDANAQEIGDPLAGRMFSEEACASCHAIQLSQMTSPDANAAPFQQIADTAGITGIALTVWLQTPHPTMPNLQLTQAEKRNLIAYILALRTSQD